METPRPPRPLHRGFRRVPAEGRRAVFRTEMRPHLVSHFIQQLFAGHAVPLAGNVRAYCGIAGDPIDASHNRLPASTSHMQSVCSHRVQLPLSLEWPIAASFGLLGGIIAAECGDTAPSRIVRSDFAILLGRTSVFMQDGERVGLFSDTQHSRRRLSGLLQNCIAWQQLTSIALYSLRSRPTCSMWSAVIPKERPQPK